MKLCRPGALVRSTAGPAWAVRDVPGLLVHSCQLCLEELWKRPDGAWQTRLPAEPCSEAGQPVATFPPAAIPSEGPAARRGPCPPRSPVRCGGMPLDAPWFQCATPALCRRPGRATRASVGPRPGLAGHRVAGAVGVEMPAGAPALAAHAAGHRPTLLGVGPEGALCASSLAVSDTPRGQAGGLRAGAGPGSARGPRCASSGRVPIGKAGGANLRRCPVGCPPQHVAVASRALLRRTKPSGPGGAAAGSRRAARSC